MSYFSKSAVLASVLLAAGGLPAYASTVSLGTLGGYNSLIVGVPTSTFTDYYTFNITKTSYVSVDYAYDFLALSGRATTTADLFSGTPSNGKNLGDNYTGDATVAMGSSSFRYGLLPAGSYYVEVAGPGGVLIDPTGCPPNSCPLEEESKYQLQIYVNPVPLPAALHGFLGGIALMGFFVWRSKRRDTAAEQGSRLIRA